MHTLTDTLTALSVAGLLLAIGWTAGMTIAVAHVMWSELRERRSGGKGEIE